MIEGARTGRITLGKKIGIGGKSSYYLTQRYEDMQADPARFSSYFAQAFFAINPFAGAEWEFIRRSPEDASRETPENAWNYDVIVTPSGTGSSSYAKELIDAYAENDRVAFIQVGWAPQSSPMGELATTGRVADAHDAFSGHADITGLVEYVSSFPNVHRVVITHGDDDLGARQALAAAIHEALPNVEVVLPAYGEPTSLLD